jgi:uncharacterized protein (TIGR03437 family)
MYCPTNAPPLWYSSLTHRSNLSLERLDVGTTFRAILLGLFSCLAVSAATFGTVVVIGGHASDLALDESRGLLYIANFGGRRVDVMSTSNHTLGSAIAGLPGEPGSLALSPDHRYLLVTNYDNCPTTSGTVSPPPCAFLTQPSNVPQLTVIDLVANVRQTVNIPTVSPSPTVPPPPSVPLAVAFGNGSKALLVTSSAIFLVDPTTKPPTFVQQTSPAVALTTGPLPTTFGTYPPQIVQASAGVSGDGRTIAVLASTGTPAPVLIRYSVGSGALTANTFATAPNLGPGVVGVDAHGANILAGWALLNQQNVLLAEFPYPTGSANIGGHAYDFQRNLIYAEVPSANAAGPPVLHILDTDNLNVRERINLPENLAGRSVFSGDMNTLYAISDSGVTVLPVGSFASAHRVAALEEQLLFQATNCVNGLLTQTLHINDLGGGHTDFSISLPANTNGIQISPSSGTTPAQVTVQVDPSAFGSQSGTTSVQVSITSNGSVGISNPVRILVNTKSPNQRGIVHSLAGEIVNILADPSRPQMYAIRQDRNQVLVLDTGTFSQLAALRTGNTPTKLTLTRDNRYLIVGNDHSQIANVFDLDSLTATPFIVFPGGHYPRTVAVSDSVMFATSRNAGTPAGLIDQIDFANRIATMPSTLGIFDNSVNPDSVMTGSPAGHSIFTATADGTVLLYDDSYAAFEAARQDLTALGGAYSAISENLFMAGGDLFNRSMVQEGAITGASLTSSILVSGNSAVVINAASAVSAGTAQRVSVGAGVGIAGASAQTIEAPVTKTILTTPPVGQIGETVLSFLRTTASINNGTTIYLSVSGFTELPPNFDQPTPSPVISSVVNMADGGQVAPGSLIVIDGSGLAASSASASGLPLPTSLAETCVAINNFPVPLIRASPTEIDAQLPYEVVGSANLVITSPGGQSGPFNFNALANAPAVFRTGQAGSLTGLPLIYRAANNQLVDISNPVHPDDILVIVATGLGVTSPPATDGTAAPANPLEYAAVPPTVTLGNVGLQVQFAGLIPGQVGTYQINAAVPHKISAGSEVPLVIEQGGISTSFNVRVVNP